MREITFRGRTLDNGGYGIKWVYGYLFRTPLTAENFEADSFQAGNNRLCIATEHGVVYEVDPLTVGEFTGFLNKNRKKIYEGDIVKETWVDGGYTINTVQFGAPEDDNDICGWFVHAEKAFTKEGKATEHRFSINLPLHWYTEHEVIGNIHDHPELLNQPGKVAVNRKHPNE